MYGKANGVTNIQAFADDHVTFIKIVTVLRTKHRSDHYPFYGKLGHGLENGEPPQ